MTYGAASPLAGKVRAYRVLPTSHAMMKLPSASTMISVPFVGVVVRLIRVCGPSGEQSAAKRRA